MKLVFWGHWMHLSHMHQWHQRTNFTAPGWILYIKKHHCHLPEMLTSASNKSNSLWSSDCGWREEQARSQGGSEGADEPPFFSDHKKSRWYVSAFGSCAFRVRSRLHAPPWACVYTARNRILKVLQWRSTSNDRRSFRMSTCIREVLQTEH